MKQNLIPALRLTFICILIFCLVYPLAILAIAQWAPGAGKGEPVMIHEKIIGYRLEGQKFTSDRYFEGRPSAVDYNGAGSGGSNKGPSNPDYLKDVKRRIDDILSRNPGLTLKEIPADLVTASGSGLDPDISAQAAMIQVPRIARLRSLSELNVQKLVENSLKKPFLNCMGTERINVLQLNIALDQLTEK